MVLYSPHWRNPNMNGEEIRRQLLRFNRAIDRSQERGGKDGGGGGGSGGRGDEGVDSMVDSKDMQQQSKAFDKLTDRVEDRQLDSTRVQEAMASIATSTEADRNAIRLREKELATVKINAAEVGIIANELELGRKVAERTLREHKGDAVAAIRSLLR